MNPCPPLDDKERAWMDAFVRQIENAECGMDPNKVPLPIPPRIWHQLRDQAARMAHWEKRRLDAFRKDQDGQR